MTFTLGMMAEEGYTVRAHCALPCCHSSELDMRRLVDDYGAGCARPLAPSLRRRLRCTVCGEKRASVTLGLPKVWKYSANDRF